MEVFYSSWKAFPFHILIKAEKFKCTGDIHFYYLPRISIPDQPVLGFFYSPVTKPLTLLVLDCRRNTVLDCRKGLVVSSTPSLACSQCCSTLSQFCGVHTIYLFFLCSYGDLSVHFLIFFYSAQPMLVWRK